MAALSGLDLVGMYYFIVVDYIMNFNQIPEESDVNIPQSSLLAHRSVQMSLNDCLLQPSFCVAHRDMQPIYHIILNTTCKEDNIVLVSL